jgi:hypothetical protein
MSTTATELDTTTAITRFLDQVERGEGIGPGIFAADAVLDATVPHWRLTRHGEAAIRAQLSTWYADPGHFTELERVEVPGGEFVRFELAWTENGEQFVARQAHALQVAGGRITAALMWCGGRWGEQLIAEIADAAH